jgi:hypothetical protein
VTDFNSEREHSSTADRNRAGYAEWIALGAVVAGSVGAIVGAARCAQRGARQDAPDSVRSDPATLTAPHGDKLSSLL